MARKKHQYFWVIETFSTDSIAADQERDRRQTCLPTGSSAAAAGCEARSAEHPADGNTRRLLPGAERPATTLRIRGGKSAKQQTLKNQ